MTGLPPELDHETKAEQFFQRYLRHTKGAHAGEPFNILPWQRVILRRIFNDLDPASGRRRIRTCYIGTPKKQGKSEFLAGCALYLLDCDPEPGAEIYSAAADRDQAKIILNAAKLMIERSPDLLPRHKVYRDVISYKPRDGSGERIYRALSHESGTKHGLNPSAVIVDELHAWEGITGREFYETLTTGFGARREPLTLIATNAGYDKQSICYEFEELVQKVEQGIIDDPSFAYFLHRAPIEMDWSSIEAFKAANPSFGITCDEGFYRQEVQRAKNSPAFQNTYKRFYLNQWTDASSAYINLGDWDACGEKFDPEDLTGRECFGGLDLANTTDLAAFALYFPPVGDEATGKLLVFFWIPGDNLRDRCLKDRVSYDAWARDGFIHTTPGNVIDHEAIEAKILELSQKYKIREIAFDRWGAVQVSTRLQAAGLQLVQFGQGMVSMSAPTKDLLRLVLSKRIAHNAHPVLRWNVSNLIVTTDAAANVKPDKSKSVEKIDGVIAAIMALGRAAVHEAGPKRSVYEDRGLLLL